MLATDDIVQEFRTDAGMVARMPVLLFLMGLLATGAILAVILVDNPARWLPAIIVALLMMTVVSLYARHRWRRGVETLEALRRASRLLHTARPQPVQVTSWYLYTNCWYLGIQPFDALPAAPVRAQRVRVPYSRIKIDHPIPAELFHDAATSVVRLQDGRTMLLATAPDELERLPEHPLPLPPRRIPRLVQLQLLTGHGMCVLFLCKALFFIGFVSCQRLSPGQTTTSMDISLAVGGALLIFVMLYFVSGYQAFRRLKYSPLGWARVEAVDPPHVPMGFFAPGKQTIHLRIRDQQHREYAQQFLARQWLTYWPRDTEIPVFFDPTGREIPKQLNAMKSYFRITEQGSIGYRPMMLAMTLLFFLMAALIMVFAALMIIMFGANAPMVVQY
ncbi:MAG TPA: hypothetical protein VGL77_12450 [Armatimonadota bacterium]|jgi:hypothetical protein